MPSPAHEWMIAVLTDDPARLDALLRAVRRSGLAAGFVVADAVAHLVDAVELRPDALLIDQVTGGWIALEVQLHPDEEKRTAWPLLAAYLTRRFGALGDVLVITPSANVAGWARKGWRIEGPMGSTQAFAPSVLHLGLAEARALLRAPAPETAFFAAWAIQTRHGPAAREIALAALRRTDELTDATLKNALARSILGVLSDPLKEALKIMISPERLPKLEPWLEELIQRWEDKGLSQGLSQGRAEGESRALLRVLARRGIAVDAITEARVTACTDTAVLEAWIDRAVTATSLHDVFCD